MTLLFGDWAFAILDRAALPTDSPLSAVPTKFLLPIGFKLLSYPRQSRVELQSLTAKNVDSALTVSAGTKNMYDARDRHL